MSASSVAVIAVGLWASVATATVDGIRGVQIRSDRVVTVWLGASANDAKAFDAASYTITSQDDPAYARPVRPTSVDRFSRGSQFRGGKVRMDHLMHLHVEKPFLPGKTYTVRLAPGVLDRKFPQYAKFSIDTTPNPSFKINQVGYSKAARVKLAYLSSYLGDGEPLDLSTYKTFEVRDAETGKKVFGGRIQPHADRDPQGFDKLYVLDLSKLRQEGEFYLWVDGLGRSYPFRNGDVAAQAMYDVCARGLFFQRSGIEIKQPYAEKWPRPMAHDKIWVTTENKGIPWGKQFDPAKRSDEYYCPQGPLEIHGGHYDAGDFDLRPMHINVPEFLMSLYEAAPEKFYDGQTNIPENRNGVPDILDEAAWNLLSLEYIQDYAGQIRKLEGGVAPGMETYRHPMIGEHGMGRDHFPYLMRRVTGYFSFSAAAEFAQAARLFKPFDEKRAAKYLERAKAAYAFAVAHQDANYKRNSGQEQGEECDPRKFNSAWCWAAGQLCATTGKPEYWKQFQKRYRQADGGVAGSISKWAILWPVLVSKQRGADAAVIREIRGWLLAEADRGVATVEANGRKGYRASVVPRGGWGNTSCVVRNIEPVTRAYLLTGKQTYLDAIATSVDFSLGMNPSEMSWMTGAGSDYPMNPCSLNSADDREDDPLPGILIYGPTSYSKSQFCALYPDKSKMGFYRQVVDVWRHIAGCEYTVWETQAPFLFAVGTLLPDAPKSVARDGADR